MPAMPSSAHTLTNIPGRHTAANGSNTANYLMARDDGTVFGRKRIN